MFINTAYSSASYSATASASFMSLPEEFTGPLSGWINVVTDYGADNTGTSNTKVAIQNALDAMSNSDAVLYFPAGTYLIEGTLTCPSTYRRMILGEDPDTTILKWTGAASGMMLICNEIGYLRLGRLTLDGDNIAGILAGTDPTAGGQFQTQSTYHDLIFKNADTGFSAGRGTTPQGAIAEATFARCSFINCTTSWDNNCQNTLDIWLWYCHFEGYTHAIYSNGGGTNNAFHCNFIGNGSNSVDFYCYHEGVWFIKKCYSHNTGQFLVTSSPQIGTYMSVIGCDVSETVNTVSLDFAYGGTLVLIDNTFKSIVTHTDGTVVDARGYNYGSGTTGNILAVGNTFTATNAIQLGTVAKSFVYDTVESAYGDVTLSAQTLPDTPAIENRHIYEIPSSYNNSQIQGVIDTAAASAYVNPIIHLQAGSYSISTTLVFPENREMIFCGDTGYGVTSLNWTGGSGGIVIQLDGPSHVELRDFIVSGNSIADCIVAKNADQSGGKVFAENLLIQSSVNSAIKVDGLDYTCIDFHSTQSMACASSVEVIGGALAAAGNWQGSIVGLSGLLTTNSGNTFIVSNGGHVISDAGWDEGTNTGEIDGVVSDNSFLTVISHIRGHTSPSVMYSLSDFTGTCAVLNVKTHATFAANFIEIAGTSNGDVLALGSGTPNGYTANIVDTSSPGCTVSSQMGMYIDSPYGHVADSGTQTESFIKGCLTDLRAQTFILPSTKTQGITDVRMYRIETLNGLSNILVQNT